MKTDCTTKSKYNKPKGLFQNYIDSPHITSHMLIDGINNIKDCIYENVKTHKDYYVFFLRILIFHMDQNSNIFI